MDIRPDQWEGQRRAGMAERAHVAMGGSRLAECGMNGAGGLTTGRPCSPTFTQIGREGRTQSGGGWGRQSSGWHRAAPHSRSNGPGGGARTRAPARGGEASGL